MFKKHFQPYWVFDYYVSASPVFLQVALYHVDHSLARKSVIMNLRSDLQLQKAAARLSLNK
jgi:hypothetical protein